MKIAEVYLKHLNKRLDTAYDYLVPMELEEEVKVGMRVVVEFGKGNRRMEACVIRLKSTSAYLGRVKAMVETIDKEPVLSEEQVELCLWMKHAYFALFYEALAYFVMAVPVKQQTDYYLKEGNYTLNLNETWFRDHYFSKEMPGVLLKKVKSEDRPILLALVEKKVVESKKNWIRQNGELHIPEVFYRLTDAGKEAVLTHEISGKKQRMILDCLQQRDMSGADLRMISVQYERALTQLIEWGYVVEILPGASKEKANLLQSASPWVQLTKSESLAYRAYRHRNQRGVFFHVFDVAGKYRLFFKAIEDQIKAGKTTVVIFPEVNMTFQRIEMFHKYFGNQVGVFHGYLNSKQRTDLFYRVKKDEVKVVIGVRSALFLPFKDLGLMIVDDEHDGSHVAVSTPKFHITEMVEKMSDMTGATYILADDIPRVSTWYRVEKNALMCIQIGEASPKCGELQIIDMQNEMHQGNFEILSRALLGRLNDCLEQKQMSVLLMNRRGYSSSVFCRDCGKTIKCSECGVALNYNRQDQVLHCRYCGHRPPVSLKCPVCGGHKIRHMGFGIEQLHEYLEKLFPKKSIVMVQGKMKRKEIEKINRAIKKNEIDILIGTQVITKHFYLANASLAAAVLIDCDLNQGNYQAAEAVYQVYRRFFEKVMGENSQGVIQTFDPDNETIYSIKNDRFDEFYRGEMAYRKLMHYPPLMDMVHFKIFTKNREMAENDAFRLYVVLKEALSDFPKGDALFKPVYAGQTSGGIVFQMVYKTSQLSAFRNRMAEIIRQGSIETLQSKVSIQINV